jgi:S1-C subfamily serine protease
MRILFLSCCILLAGCAPQPQPRAAAPDQDSLLPGTIGVMAKRTPAGVVVAEVRDEGAAAAVGVRAGDRVLRFNGAPVTTLREFYRQMLDSRPGSTAQLEVERDGRVRTVELPVRELDTMPRV